MWQRLFLSSSKFVYLRVVGEKLVGIQLLLTAFLVFFQFHFQTPYIHMPCNDLHKSLEFLGARKIFLFTKRLRTVHAVKDVHCLYIEDIYAY